jgi:poly-gamma-glutamate capsule biosynthesis protein CapA/YwtB (metallophosphatase superfamily)
MNRKVLYLIISFSFLLLSQVFAQVSPVETPVITATISAVGDLMCHSAQYKYAKTENGEFDFNPPFQFIKKYLINSDFTFGNFETVTAGESRGFSTYPLFNSPDEYITALKNNGFNLLTTANNHALDRGKNGVIRTIEEMNKNNINYTGTFESEKDRDSIRIFNIKGIKIAFLAYTYGTNGIPVPKGSGYLVNIIDPELIYNDVKKAREKGAEIVLVYLHFGDQYVTRPTSYQKETVKKVINAGADIIIGGHPHVLQPVQYFKTKNAKLDTGFIAYSMGNFFSNQRERYTDAGMILNISLSKNLYDGSIYISNVSYTPTWVFKGEVQNKNEFLILPSEEVMDYFSLGFLDGDNIYKVDQSIADTKNILTKYTDNIKLFNYEQDIIQKLKELAQSAPLERPKIFWNFSHDKTTIFSLNYFSK